jgi:hypothetical protein
MIQSCKRAVHYLLNLLQHLRGSCQQSTSSQTADAHSDVPVLTAIEEGHAYYDWYNVPFVVGDRVRCLTICSSSCGMTGTVMKICPFVSIPRRLRIRYDGTAHFPEGEEYEHQYHPPPMQSLELETPSARYSTCFTREVEQLLIAQAHDVIGSRRWDLTSAVLMLNQLTGVRTQDIVRTLCRLADEGCITQPATRYWGGPYHTPTRLRVRKSSTK